MDGGTMVPVFAWEEMGNTTVPKEISWLSCQTQWMQHFVLCANDIQPHLKHFEPS